MALIFGNYFFTAWLLRRVTPGFGRLAQVEAKLEGDFRGVHSRLITNAEEVAFYDGGGREFTILEHSYKTLIKHVNRILRLRIFYNMFEDFIIKYAWSAVGLLICSVPVFFPAYAGAHSGGSSHGGRTQGFITNKRLMISLADAGGRIMYSYKEMAELAGYTARVHELLEMLQQVGGRSVNPRVSYDFDGVDMQHVLVETPGHDMLVRDLTLRVEPGQHLLISGANGVGKSAVMRVIAQLWPLSVGKMRRPADEDMIFVP